MNQETSIEDKKSSLQNDRRLVCGMFVFYGLCILGLMAGTLWGLDQRSKKISANATSTAFARATQQAKVTATAIAHATEQTQYEVIDRFNSNAENWKIESSDNEYMNGSISITKGVYLWNIQQVKKTFVWWANFRKEDKFEDFDVYVDSKIVDREPGDACSGLIFRNASMDREKGAYIFAACSNSTFSIYYYEEEEWESILEPTYSNAIRSSDWNRLEVSARGDDFNLAINNETIFKMKDDRLPKGGLAVYIEVNEKRPVSISFDNFGLQPR